ncbi:MAG TPA: tetratricopeptide repeat protein [Pirellulales bacterium]|nr:tetratricopeptide repeat protein [Pirellulales bacterium]
MDTAALKLALAEAARQESANLQVAEATLRRLLAEAPRQTVVHVHLARFLHRLGRTPEAILIMQEAVRLDQKPSLLNDLGTLLYAAGDTTAAIEAYHTATDLDPNYVLGALNLADALARGGRLDQAVSAYRRAIALDPKSLDPHVGLAQTLLRAGDPAAAIDECRAALQIDPKHPTALQAMAVALAKIGDFRRAVEFQTAALVSQPQSAAMWHTLGNLLDESGQIEQAANAYRRAIQLDPQSIEAEYDLSALTETNAPRSMPHSYVIRLFDDFAPTFERRLVEELEYHVPEALREAVAPHLAEPPGRSLEVLDLGCGTGLIGRQFRDVAARLVGVDLSQGMLAAAAATGIYDELICDDVVEYMAKTDSRFDVILAADLFIYIGDLQPFFIASAKALRAGGLLAFSIETISGSPYLLRRTRRYAHSLSYVTELADRYSMQVLESRPTAIRRGDGGSVAGHVIVVRRNGED